MDKRVKINNESNLQGPIRDSQGLNGEEKQKNLRAEVPGDVSSTRRPPIGARRLRGLKRVRTGCGRTDRKSTRLNSSHSGESRMPSSA